MSFSLHTFFTLFSLHWSSPHSISAEQPQLSCRLHSTSVLLSHAFTDLCKWSSHTALTLLTHSTDTAQMPLCHLRAAQLLMQLLRWVTCSSGVFAYSWVGWVAFCPAASSDGSVGIKEYFSFSSSCWFKTKSICFSISDKKQLVNDAGDLWHDLWTVLTDCLSDWVSLWNNS